MSKEDRGPSLNPRRHEDVELATLVEGRSSTPPSHRIETGLASRNPSSMRRIAAQAKTMPPPADFRAAEEESHLPKPEPSEDPPTTNLDINPFKVTISVRPRDIHVVTALMELTGLDAADALTYAYRLVAHQAGVPVSDPPPPLSPSRTIQCAAQPPNPPDSGRK